jgi:hypothetical protein
MPYAASSAPASREEVHDASAADQERRPHPASRTVHPARQIAAKPGGARQLPRARPGEQGGLPTARLQRTSMLNLRSGIPACTTPHAQACPRRQRRVTISPGQGGQIAEYEQLFGQNLRSAAERRSSIPALGSYLMINGSDCYQQFGELIPWVTGCARRAGDDRDGLEGLGPASTVTSGFAARL